MQTQNSAFSFLNKSRLWFLKVFSETGVGFNSPDESCDAIEVESQQAFWNVLIVVLAIAAKLSIPSIEDNIKEPSEEGNHYDLDDGIIAWAEADSDEYCFDFLESQIVPLVSTIQIDYDFTELVEPESPPLVAFTDSGVELEFEQNLEISNHLNYYDLEIGYAPPVLIDDDDLIAQLIG